MANRGAIGRERKEGRKEEEWEKKGEGNGYRCGSCAGRNMQMMDRNRNEACIVRRERERERERLTERERERERGKERGRERKGEEGG